LQCAARQPPALGSLTALHPAVTHLLGNLRGALLACMSVHAAGKAPAL